MVLLIALSSNFFYQYYRGFNFTISVSLSRLVESFRPSPLFLGLSLAKLVSDVLVDVLDVSGVLFTRRKVIANWMLAQGFNGI